MSEPIDDPYLILGVARGASAEEIRRQYKKLAVENHPDRNTDPAALERFKQVSAAYSILNDPIARRRWEQDRANTAYEVEPRDLDDPLGEHRHVPRSRPLSPEERRRRREFAQRYSKAVLHGKLSEVERQQRRLFTYVQNTLAAVLATLLLIWSISNGGLPFTSPEAVDTPFLVFIFWVGVISGFFLIWTPDVGQDLFLDNVPAPLLQFLGWMALLGTPLFTWMLSSLTM